MPHITAIIISDHDIYILLTAVNDPLSLDDDFQARAKSYVPGSLDFNNHRLNTGNTIREIEIIIQARRASEAIPWKMESNFREKHQQKGI